MATRLIAAAVATLVLCGGRGALAASTEQFSVMANKEVVGHLTATTDQSTVDINYSVSNNGRGPKHTEHLALGQDGIPVSWTIDGSSEMGGNVHEEMTYKAGLQSWISQADKGEQREERPALYIGNDAGPYAIGIYARALLRTKSHQLNVLPAGTIGLEEMKSLTVGDGTKSVPVTAYFVTGIGLDPDLILLDRQGRLFAELSGGLVIRAGYENEFTALKTLAQSIVLEHLRSLQSRLAHVYDVPVRIRNVRVFDPLRMALTGLEAVVVYRGHVTTVEPDSSAPSAPDEVVIDGQGGSLVAGLHDVHSHNSMWSGPLNVAGGVTTVRDMGNDNEAFLALKKHTDDGDIIGPHIIPSGFIEGRSPYSARNGFVIDTLDQGLHAVQWYGDRGYIQIKIYNSMNPAWVAPLSSEARRLGMRTVGHVPAFATPDQMIEAGYNEITHINQLMLGWLLNPGEDTRTPLRLTAMERAADLDLASAKVRHTIDLMKAHDVGLDTTTSIVEMLMLSRAGEVPANSAAYLSHMPIGVQRYRMRSYVTFKDAAQSERYNAAFAKVIDTMRLLHKEGIPMWPGTDEAIGFTLHRELELYVEAGYTPAEALRVATYDADKYLKRDQLYGSIERGKMADFFLTEGDPTKDIGALHHIRMVLKDGVIYFPSEIYHAYGITPFADAPPVAQPSVPVKYSQLPPISTANAFDESGGD